MDKNTRWVFLGYSGIGLLVAWVMSSTMQWIFYTLSRYLRDVELLGGVFTLSGLIGIGITAIVGVVLWKKPDINTAAHEVVEELRKVTWPTSKETQSATIVVVITTIVIATILWFFDFVWAWTTSLIYGSGQG